MAIINFLKTYQRIARFKWGRFDGIKGPGTVFLIPIMHVGVKIGLRTEVMDISTQGNITVDNAPIDIDLVVHIRVLDDPSYSQRAVLNVVNYRSAVEELATTALREVVGEFTVDDLLSQRERINTVLRERFDAETEHWGIKVENVRIATSSRAMTSERQ